MIGKEIIENEPIPSSQVRKIIDDFSETNELNYQQNLALNHISRFPRYSPEDSEEIYRKLIEEFDLREKVATHIVDLVPKDLDDMRLIFAKEPSKVDNDDMKKILEMLEEYDVED